MKTLDQPDEHMANPQVSTISISPLNRQDSIHRAQLGSVEDDVMGDHDECV